MADMAGDMAEKPTPLRLRDVAVVRDGVAILDGIDWDIGTGERWAVLGPNGSGKTTLLRVAGMRLLPTRGTVEVLGESYGRSDARAVRRRVAFVSQSILRGLRPTLSARDVVLTGRHAALETWWHEYSHEDRSRADSLLRAAGLAEAADRHFGVLSEGERQQVLLARALMASPEVLLLDEPAAGLDLGAREGLVTYLAALAADPETPPLVLVTHHVEELPAGITHVALISRGRFTATGPVVDVLTSQAVSSCFGIPIAIQRTDGRWTARAVVDTSGRSRRYGRPRSRAVRQQRRAECRSGFRILAPHSICTSGLFSPRGFAVATCVFRSVLQWEHQLTSKWGTQGAVAIVPIATIHQM